MTHIYILYRITNKVNNKFYIGVHKTKDINDDYYGSGHSIKAAIEKYGKENFKKEVLHIFTNAKKAFKKEKEIVNEHLVKDENCYNIKEGGYGGFEHIRKTGLHKSSKGRKIIHKNNEQTKVKPEDLEKYLNQGWKLGFKPSSLKKMSESGKIKIQSEEQKRKNSETKKGSTRMLNPITNKMKFVKKEFVNNLLNKGWSLYKLKRKNHTGE
jgi:hypothetical protein